MTPQNVRDILFDTLDAAFHLPIFLQGSLDDDEAYPEAFFTYWNNSTDDDSFFDNRESRANWNFDLNFYSIDPSDAIETLFAAKDELRKVGFIPDGAGYDVPSDEDSHFGRGMRLIFIDTGKRGERNG